jgi:hypothetical protein
MRRIAMWSAAAVLPAVLVSALVGCSSSTTTGGGAAPTNASTSGGGGGDKPTAIVAKETGTLKGKVTFKGNKADLKLDEMTATLRKEMENKDAQHCIKDVSEKDKAQTEQQVWRIADDGAIANVIVYLKAPKGKFFAIDPAKVKYEKEKILDQPHCAFIPHVQVLFPEYRTADNTKKATDQKFIIENSSSMQHNTKIDALNNFNKSIEAKGKITVEDVKPTTSPMTINCTIHPFMAGYAFPLNHPYAAVTNEKGEFEIADVPADVPVDIMVWHEEGVCKDYEKGKETKLKTGENKMDFVIEKK